MNRITKAAVVLVFGWNSVACAQGTHAYHDMQARGHIVMGVDQYTSVHAFEDMADGGRIELQRDSLHEDGVETIRSHLQSIAAAFKRGDFSAPALVHMKAVPGVRVMTQKRAVITYTYHELPRGGELYISTTNKAAISAIHEFLAFQRMEHHAGM